MAKHLAGNGRGSVNAMAPRFTKAGVAEDMSLKLQGNLISQLRHASENLHPNRIAQHKKTLAKVAETLDIAHNALHKSSREWCGCANVDFIVAQQAEAMEQEGIEQEGLAAKHAHWSHPTPSESL